MIYKLLKSIFSKDKSRSLSFQKKFRHFQALLAANNEAHKFMSELSEMIVLGKPFSKGYANSLFRGLMQNTKEIVVNLVLLSNGKYLNLLDKLEELNIIFDKILSPRIHCPEGWDCADYECDICQKVKKINDDIPYYYNITGINDSLFLEVGSKMSRLGEIKNRLGMTVPDGFCITARLFDEFINLSGLRKEIDNILSAVNFDYIEEIQKAGREIQELIINTPIPESLEKIILDAFEASFTDKNVKLAVRSSALGEDSVRYSFAGLHRSELNIGREDLVDACWEVLLSKYSPESLVYRYISGLRDEDMPMSVGCIEMVDSIAGGVLFTQDTLTGTDDIVIQAVRGLGTLVVKGEVAPQEFLVDRQDCTIRHFKPGNQRYMERLKRNGGLTRETIPGQQQKLPCMSDEIIAMLCNKALAIEKHFGCPLDIEWGIDKGGNIYILQARPLKDESRSSDRQVSNNIKPDLSKYNMLIKRGDCASTGIAAGTVFVLDSSKMIKNFPNKSIIVARKNLPEFTRIIHKAAAVITDSGSTTGHLSIIARELNVPVLTNTEIASQVLHDGMEITLDAAKSRVYEGIVSELLDLSTRQNSLEEPFQKSPLYRIWHRLTRFIFKLNLTDPNSHLFTPDNCQTLHDIIRLAHEVSMKEMFSLYENARVTGGMTFRLRFSVPIDIYIIDLGNGLNHHRNSIWVHPEDIVSKPFSALIKGMTTPGIQWAGPLSMDFKGFMNIMMANITDSHKADRDIGSRSYSLISENYLNFFSRLGYHFSRLDAFAGSETNSNYITFNFRGGAADPVRRSRRARVIRQILDHYNFSTTCNNDNITGSIRKIPEETVLFLLSEIGRLMGAVRNTDVTMVSEEYMDMFVTAFLEGDPAPASRFVDMWK